MKSIPHIFIGAILISLTVLSGCKREYDEPPARILPVGQILTIQELRDLYVDQAITFTEELSVYGVVTADETNGNLYRSIYVQDGNAAINLRLQNPGGLYEGDSVRIYLPGTVLSIFSGMLQLDNVNVDENIIKQATQINFPPALVSISDITPALQGQLIRLENVEFVESELGSSYADAVNQSTENRTLTDCDGNTILVRSSGFANFAGLDIPEGNGSFVAIVGQFNDDMQLYIRDLTEVQLNGERCTGGGGGGPCEYEVQPVFVINQDFTDVASNDTDYNNENWVNVATEGSRVWRGRIFQDSKYLRATSFGSNQTNEAWFITPPVQLSGPQLGLSFESATAFWNDAAWPHPLTVYASTDFNGCDIDQANWVTITGYNVGNQGTANYAFIPSGTVLVTDFLPSGFSGAVHIAFVYRGSHPDGVTTSLDLDNIIIQ